MSGSSSDNAEKAVKMLVENHRIALTLVGLFIAGLFAFAGKGLSALDWRYFAAQGCFVIAGIAILMSVSVAISQAKSGKYDVSDSFMSLPYGVGVLLIVVGLVFTGHFLLFPAAASPSTTTVSGIQIDATGARISPDTKLRMNVHYDPSGTKIQSIDIAPP
jgi:hypothetical protein